MSARIAAAGAAALVGLLLLGCPSPATRADPAATVETISAWLECEECADGELAAVTALGDGAVPMLAAVLDQGLSPATRASLADQLAERWRARVAYASRSGTPPPALGSADYVASGLARRDALHRSRAATALGRIATPDAERALRTAAHQRQVPSVEAAIQAALGSP